jgi:hypothetical protein
MANPIETWNNAVKVGDTVVNLIGDYKTYKAYRDLVDYTSAGGEGGLVGTNTLPSNIKYLGTDGVIKQAGKIKAKTLRSYFTQFAKSQANSRFKIFADSGIDSEDKFREAVSDAGRDIVSEAGGRMEESVKEIVTKGLVDAGKDVLGVGSKGTQKMITEGADAGLKAAGVSEGKRKLIKRGLTLAGGAGSVVAGAINYLPNPTNFEAPQFTPEGTKTATFVSPGTDILGKIKAKKLPVNPVDMAALEHDIAYGLADNNAKVRRADNRFIKRLEAIAKLHPDDEYNSMLAGGAIKVKNFAESFIPEFLGGVAYDDQEWLSKQKPSDQKLLKTLYKKLNKMSSKKFVDSFRDPEIYSTLGASKALALVPEEGAKTLKGQVLLGSRRPEPRKSSSKALSLVKGEGVRDVPVMDGVKARLPKSIEIKDLPVRKARPMSKALSLVKGEGVRDVPVMDGVKARLPYDIEITDPKVSRFEQEQILQDLQTKYENIRVQKLKQDEEQSFNRRERKFRPEVREFNPERLNVFLSRDHEAEENRLFANFNYVEDDPLKPKGGDNPLYRDNLINDAIRYGYTILLPKDYQPTGTNMLVARPGVKPPNPRKIPQGEDVDIPANNSKKSFRTLDKSIYRNLRKNRV